MLSALPAGSSGLRSKSSCAAVIVGATNVSGSFLDFLADLMADLVSSVSDVWHGPVSLTAFFAAFAGFLSPWAVLRVGVSLATSAVWSQMS